MKLNKIFPLFLYLLGFLILGINDGHVSGNTNDIPPSFEEIYPEIGYKSVDAAVDDFEQHFNQELMLPIRVPPISLRLMCDLFNIKSRLKSINLKRLN